MEKATMLVRSKKIYSLQLDISQTISKSFNVSVESNAQVKKPKDENNHTVLISMESQMRTPDSDEVFGNLKSEFIIECTKKPDDTEIEDKCIPFAQNELLEALYNILEAMGLMKDPT